MQVGGVPRAVGDGWGVFGSEGQAMRTEGTGSESGMEDKKRRRWGKEGKKDHGYS